MATTSVNPYDPVEMDPGVARLLARKRDRLEHAAAYTPLTTDAVTKRLVDLFALQKPGTHVADVMRVGGGASKERFATVTGDFLHPDAPLTAGNAT